jgi:hypothetical protein
MKKITITFFTIAFIYAFSNTGCSKKSANPPTPNDTTSVPHIIDTVVVAGGNGIGTAANQLAKPAGVTVDGSGDVYVLDGSNRVQKWAPGADSGITVAGGNGIGNNANQLNTASSIYLDITGNLYVADFGNDRIQKFPAGSTSATNGVTVAGGNGPGPNANQLNGPNGICLDPLGNIYVSTQTKIVKFPSNSNSVTNGSIAAGNNGAGLAANQLDNPAGLFIDENDNLYIADNDNYRVQKFPPNSNQSSTGVTVAGGNGKGSGANQLSYPNGIAADGDGNVYVCDGGNNRIQKWAPGATTGVTVAGSSTGISGSAYNQLNSPLAIFLDAGAKNLYICDYGNNRIVKWGLK